MKNKILDIIYLILVVAGTIFCGFKFNFESSYIIGLMWGLYTAVAIRDLK